MGVRRLLSEGAYIPWIQDLITPAQYWHNPLNNEEFLAGSHYLADINNERQEKNSEYRENIEKLENFVMAKWLQDTTIIPGASAQFGFYLRGLAGPQDPGRGGQTSLQGDGRRPHGLQLGLVY